MCLSLKVCPHISSLYTLQIPYLEGIKMEQMMRCLAVEMRQERKRESDWQLCHGTRAFWTPWKRKAYVRAVCACVWMGLLVAYPLTKAHSTRAVLCEFGSGELACHTFAVAVAVGITVKTITHIHIFRPARGWAKAQTQSGNGCPNWSQSSRLILPDCDKKVSTQTWQSYKCLIFITVAWLRGVSKGRVSAACSAT